MEPDLAVTPQHLEVFPLLADLDEREIARIALGLRPVSVPSGACLFVQGQPADSAFFLVSGSVDVLVRLPGGDEVAVTQLGPGSTLGETSIVEDGLRIATVRASCDTTGFTIRRQYVQASILQFDPSMFKILRRAVRVLCARQRGTLAQTMDLRQADPRRAGVPVGARVATAGRWDRRHLLL